MEVFNSPYYNCVNLLLTASMKRSGKRTTDLWNKIGFHYNPFFSGSVSPYYLKLEDEIQTYGFNIKFQKIKSLEDARKEIDYLINNGIILGVNLDIYFLEYSLYHKEIHQKHAVEVYGYDNDKFYICDHYYNYKGEITRENFMDIISRTFDKFGSSIDIFYLEKTENKVESYNSVICSNIKFLRGEMKYSGETDLSETGIDNIPLFAEHLIDEFSDAKSIEEKDELFNNYYPALKEISFSRYHLSKYIGLIDEETALSVHDASQSWSIAAHLLLMSNVSKKYSDMMLRIEKVLGKLHLKENEYVNRLELLSNKLKQENIKL